MADLNFVPTNTDNLRSNLAEWIRLLVDSQDNSGRYASGGLVEGGKPYIVGEHCCELRFKQCEGCRRVMYARQGRWCQRCASTNPDEHGE